VIEAEGIRVFHLNPNVIGTDTQFPIRRSQFPSVRELIALKGCFSLRPVPARQATGPNLHVILA